MSRADVVGVIIPTARLFDGFKGPDTTTGLLGTAFLCPNVRTSSPQELYQAGDDAPGGFPVLSPTGDATQNGQNRATAPPSTLSVSRKHH